MTKNILTISAFVLYSFRSTHAGDSSEDEESEDGVKALLQVKERNANSSSTNHKGEKIDVCIKFSPVRPSGAILEP